jgi:hypothetical protein
MVYLECYPFGQHAKKTANFGSLFYAYKQTLHSMQLFKNNYE